MSSTISVSSTISYPNMVSIISSRVTIPIGVFVSSSTSEMCSRFFSSLSKSGGIFVFSLEIMIGRFISFNLKSPFLFIM